MDQVAELKRKIIESFAEIGVGVRVKIRTKENRTLNVVCEYDSPIGKLKADHDFGMESIVRMQFIDPIVIGLIDEYNRALEKGMEMIELEQELAILKISKSKEVADLEMLARNYEKTIEGLRYSLSGNTRLLNKSVVVNVIFIVVNVILSILIIWH